MSEATQAAEPFTPDPVPTFYFAIKFEPKPAKGLPASIDDIIRQAKQVDGDTVKFKGAVDVRFLAKEQLGQPKVDPLYEASKGKIRATESGLYYLFTVPEADMQAQGLVFDQKIFTIKPHINANPR